MKKGWTVAATILGLCLVSLALGFPGQEEPLEDDFPFIDEPESQDYVIGDPASFQQHLQNSFEPSMDEETGGFFHPSNPDSVHADYLEQMIMGGVTSPAFGGGGGILLDIKKVVGRVKKCGKNDGHSDECTFPGKGKDCAVTVSAGGETTSWCCDIKNGECACNQENTNPCTDPAQCAACMAYAEAGGTNIPDSCMAGVLCTLSGRVESSDYPNDYCGNASNQQGDTTHFEPYKCVCDSGNDNQKYCECCAKLNSGEELDPENAEDAEIQTALDQAAEMFKDPNKACTTDNKPTGFFSGSGSIPSGCKKVTVKGCSSLTFYKC